MITGDIRTGTGGGEKANYFIIILHLLSSFIIGCHHPKLGFDSRRRLRLICEICGLNRNYRITAVPTASPLFTLFCSTSNSFSGEPLAMICLNWVR